MLICPCGTGKDYELCCGPLHQGKTAQTALDLMRSRYSAYARGLADYIIKTTHPENPYYKNDFIEWRSEIMSFCDQTSFNKLVIVSHAEGTVEAYVTFIAHLKQNQMNKKLVEKSQFMKNGGVWQYYKPITVNIT